MSNTNNATDGSAQMCVNSDDVTSPCICYSKWTGTLCDIPWSEYRTSIDVMRWTLISVHVIITIITIWRLTVLTQWRTSARQRRRIAATAVIGHNNNNGIIGNGGTIIGTTAAAAAAAATVATGGGINGMNGSSNKYVIHRDEAWYTWMKHTDTQWWMFVFIIFACILLTLDSFDPLLSAGIWTDVDLAIIRILTLPVGLDGIALWVRFYLLIHAKWHTPTRRVVSWFDRFFITVNVLSLVGILSVSFAPDLVGIFYLIIGVLTIIVLMVSSAIYAQITLKSLITRLHPSATAPSTATATVATPSAAGHMTATTPTPALVTAATMSQRTPFNLTKTTSSAIAGHDATSASATGGATSGANTTAATSNPSSPLPLILSSSSPTWATATAAAATQAAAQASASSHAANNQSAYHAATEMLNVIRWCQLLALCLIILITYHTFFNANNNDPVPAIIYNWVLRCICAIGVLSAVWSLGRISKQNVITTRNNGSHVRVVPVYVSTHRAAIGTTAAAAATAAGGAATGPTSPLPRHHHALNDGIISVTTATS